MASRATATESPKTTGVRIRRLLCCARSVGSGTSRRRTKRCSARWNGTKARTLCAAFGSRGLRCERSPSPSTAGNGELGSARRRGRGELGSVETQAAAQDTASVVDRQAGADGEPARQDGEVVAAGEPGRVGECDRQPERRLLALAGEAGDGGAVGEQSDRGQHGEEQERSRQKDRRFAPQAARAARATHRSAR